MTAVISNAELEAIRMLEQGTGALAKDVVFTPSAVVFVVKQGDLGKAIGRQGKNIWRLEKMFGRGVQFVEEATELRNFAANLFAPAQVLEVKQSNSAGGKKMVFVKVDAKNKGLAIGAKGEKINRARTMLQRHFGIDDVKIV